MSNPEPTIETPPARQEWKCFNCGELVPGNFEACWKCLTTRSGERTPDA